MQTIGKNIFEVTNFLNKLSKTKSIRKRFNLIKLATDQELSAIIEIAFNILKKRFNLSKSQHTKLIPHVQALRRIGRTRSKRGIKKVFQSGEGLAIIPALIAPILIELTRHVINGQ